MCPPWANPTIAPANPVGTPRSSTTTCVCRSTTSWAVRPVSVRASRWRRSGSDPGVFTTPCAGSGRVSVPSTCCASGRSRATPMGRSWPRSRWCRTGSLRATPRCRRPGCSRCRPRGRWTSCTLRVSTTAMLGWRSASSSSGARRCSTTSSTAPSRSTVHSDTPPTCRSRACTARLARHASTTAPTRCTRSLWPDRY